MTNKNYQLSKNSKVNNKDNLEMDEKYDLINQTESENRKGYEVPKQPTELEHKGGYMEDLKTSKYVKPKISIGSQHRQSYTAAEHRQ